MGFREYAYLFLAMTGALFWAFMLLLVIVPSALHWLFRGKPT